MCGLGVLHAYKCVILITEGNMPPPELLLYLRHASFLFLLFYGASGNRFANIDGSCANI